MRDPEQWLRTASKQPPGQRQTLDSWLHDEHDEHEHDDTTSVEPAATPTTPAPTITQGARARTPVPRRSASSIFDNALSDHVHSGAGNGRLDLDRGQEPWR